MAIIEQMYEVVIMCNYYAYGESVFNISNMIHSNHRILWLEDEAVYKILDESHKKLDEEIKLTRDGLNSKLNTVREIEGKSHAAGFNLKGLTQAEQKALNAVL